MKPPIDPRHPTIRQFAIRLGRSPAEFVRKFDGYLPCDAAGRIIVPEAIRALKLLGCPADAWLAEKADPDEITEFDLADQGRAMAALDAERWRQNMLVADLEEKSGVSANTFYAWRGVEREPTLGCLVAVAQTLGFDILMVRRKSAAGKG